MLSICGELKNSELVLEACLRRPGGRASKRPGVLDDVDSGKDDGDVSTPPLPSR